MDPRIKLRHISVFTEIVRLGSLKRAAERLNLTQPAISRALAELEAITGARLLTRGRAGVALTAEGEGLYHFAQLSLGALEQGLAATGPGGGALRMRIGALPSVAARLMPEVVTEAARIAPDLRLSVLDGAHGYLTGQLRAGDLDMVIGRLGAPDTMRGLSFTQLYTEEIAFVVRPGHPLLARPDISRLGEFPVIFPTRSAAIRPFAERLLIAAGVPEPARRLETVSGALGHVLTARSDAVWIISAGVVAQAVAEGRLRRLPFDTAGTSGPVGLMVRAEEPAPPGRQLVLRAIDRAVSTLGLG
ncbi:MAG: pca operon transcription factor PcaQ [Paracoccus sp. (in: a-proteobacteria)]|nr:pca operon transcription factor PcaQ [Paracoccus sp. (in: a-proteobacteria)]